MQVVQYFANVWPSLEGVAGWHDATARFDEQGIAQSLAQSVQGVSDRGLAYSNAHRCFDTLPSSSTVMNVLSAQISRLTVSMGFMN